MSDKPQSLAEYLGLTPAAPDDEGPRLVDITDPKEFGKAVMESREFRQYIVNGLTYGNVPGFTTILKFYLEHVCGKTPDRVEHTGKDGAPIETITEVRRVVVHSTGDRALDEDLNTIIHPQMPPTTH